ncbi:unnamed protein product [Alopecurus aequalis]
MSPSHRDSQPFDLVAEATPELDDDGRAARTGNLWTCMAHIITGVIGAGVLALSWSVAQLGWVAGPVAMLCFAAVTYVSALLLSHCYRSPVAAGAGSSGRTRRNYTYMDAVGAILGRKHTYVCGILQYLNLYGVGVAYTITTATCLGAIKKSNCYHGHGRGAARCGSEAGEQHLFMLLFGLAQLALSFIPNFHSMAWLSAVAAAMSFTYTTIGMGLGLAKTVGDGAIRGTVTGVPMATDAQKVWQVAQAVGDIAFAYPYTIVLLEIQDTLRSSPPEGETMRKGNVIAVLATTSSISALPASATPPSATPRRAISSPALASTSHVQPADIHGGGQVAGGEVPGELVRAQDVHHQDRAGAAGVRAEPATAVLQDGVRGEHDGLAVVFPYFNEVLGLLGALIFWPLVIYLPVQMYCVQRRVMAWTPTWVALQAFNVACFAVGTFAFVGCVEGVVRKRLG